MQTFKITEATDEISALICQQIQGCETFDDVKMALNFESSPFHNWLVYKGGTHCALHRVEGARRSALIVKNDLIFPAHSNQ